MRTIPLRLSSIALVAFLLLSAFSPMTGVVEPNGAVEQDELPDAAQRLLVESARSSTNLSHRWWQCRRL
jgi:hypothetical protein